MKKTIKKSKKTKEQIRLGKVREQGESVINFTRGFIETSYANSNIALEEFIKKQGISQSLSYVTSLRLTVKLIESCVIATIMKDKKLK